MKGDVGLQRIAYKVLDTLEAFSPTKNSEDDEVVQSVLQKMKDDTEERMKGLGIQKYSG